MIQEGKSDQEIKDYVTSRFGKESLYEPEFNNSTYILWLAPFVVLFLALLIFIFHMRNIFGIQFRLQAHHVHSTI